MRRRRSLRLLVLLLLLILPERGSVVSSMEPRRRRTRRLLVAPMSSVMSAVSGRSVVGGTGVSAVLLVLAGVALGLVVARVEPAGLGHGARRGVVGGTIEGGLRLRDRRALAMSERGSAGSWWDGGTLAESERSLRKTPYEA